ncbi:hypothetical protein D3C87_2137600 [compost metagenome]
MPFFSAKLSNSLKNATRIAKYVLENNFMDSASEFVERMIFTSEFFAHPKNIRPTSNPRDDLSPTTIREG